MRGGLSLRGPVASSELDSLLELRHRVLAPANTSGEKLDSWPTPYARVWANKRDLVGDRRFVAEQFASEQTTQFRLRWRGDILSTDRFVDVDSGETYEINQIAEIGRKDGLDLLCRRLVP
jgi:SPP1 family predicted phage head-tail adaptor